MITYEFLCEKILEAKSKYLSYGGKDPTVYMNKSNFEILKHGSAKYQKGFTPTVFGMPIKIVEETPDGVIFMIQEDIY